MTVEDLRVTREVRHVLARKWIKLQRLNYMVVNGVLYLRGRVELMRGSDVSRQEKELDRFGVGPRFLALIERELVRIDGIRSIRWEVDGWRKTTTGWNHHGL